METRIKSCIGILLLLAGMGALNAQESKNMLLPGISGAYMGLPPPGVEPVVFAPGIISTGLDELNSVFYPDGSEFYFSIRNPDFSTIFVCKLENDQWSAPDPMPFTSAAGDVDVSVSPDGQRLFFSSRRRTVSGEESKPDFDIWYCIRDGNNWDKPVTLGENINSQSDDFYPVVTRDGTIYFNSQRAGRGTNDIYTARWTNGNYGPAEKLGKEINTEYREYDAWVDPEGMIMIFASDRPGGYGQSDLYISFRAENNAWSQPVNMGPKINGIGNEYSPTMSPDGRFLFYTRQTWTSAAGTAVPESRDFYVRALNSFDNLLGNIWWVDAGIIEALKPRK